MFVIILEPVGYTLFLRFYHFTCSPFFRPSAEGVHVRLPCKRKKTRIVTKLTAPPTWQHSLNMLDKVASRALIQQNILRGAELLAGSLLWVRCMLDWWAALYILLPPGMLTA